MDNITILQIVILTTIPNAIITCFSVYSATLNAKAAKINLEIAMSKIDKSKDVVLNTTPPKIMRIPFLFIIGRVFALFTIAIIALNLYGEFRSIEPITRTTLFNVCVMFFLLVSNILFWVFNSLSRYIGKWIDDLMDIDESMSNALFAADDKFEEMFKTLNNKK